MIFSENLILQFKNTVFASLFWLVTIIGNSIFFFRNTYLLAQHLPTINDPRLAELFAQNLSNEHID